MSLVHQQTAWGRLVGVTLLMCIAGCSLREAPVPPPPVPQAPAEAAPAPAPQDPAPQVKEATPTGKPATTQTGMASWYGPRFHGKETASGETFDRHALTAAHRTLPLGTEATVTNVDTGQSVTVEITDRGPSAQGRHIDPRRLPPSRLASPRKASPRSRSRPSRHPRPPSDAQCMMVRKYESMLIYDHLSSPARRA
jgi:rare lipoprotein A